MRGVVTASPTGRLSSPRLDLDRRPSKSLASSSSSTSLLLPLRPRPRNLSPLRSPRPPRTSEFWYEDEEEFDAIAGSLRRKTVHVVGGGGGGGGGDGNGNRSEEEEAKTTTATAKAAAEQLAGVPFDACFYGQPGDEEAGLKSCCPALSVLWPASRSGPPYFLRPRRRPALDELSRRVSSSSSSSSSSPAEGASSSAADAAAAAAAAADAAWADISSQNWRVELAYGLGGTKAAVGGSSGGGGGGGEEKLLDPERPEAVLVVVAPAAAARALAGAAAAAFAAASASSTTNQQLYSVITLREWEGGIDSVDATAPGWRELLEEK